MVAGARPNFMKVAPLVRAIEKHNSNKNAKYALVDYVLVHTGQHYDWNMSEAFFKDLKLPQPHVHLGVGSASHAEQTGRTMIELEKTFIRERPDLVVVVGDVNSTLAGALSAVKLNIPLAHVEAGLRSFDRTMPEEINRLVTDVLSTYLFTPSPDANENLLKEGVSKEKIYLVGDIMIDSLLFHLDEAKLLNIPKKLGLLENPHSFSERVSPFALLTLHRPSNVDDPRSLGKIMAALEKISKKISIIFPVHPRTRKQLTLLKLGEKIEFHQTFEGPILSSPGIHAIEPLGYLSFLSLMISAQIVLTDSGGIQEETTFLGIPCLTLRDTTERPITLTEGTNVLVSNDTERIVKEALHVLNEKPKKPKMPAYWDGKTAERIIRILIEEHSNHRKSTIPD
jgi:UDP-N-acetylglucosamine 2-epimerase (non-hydrolysing)